MRLKADSWDVEIVDDDTATLLVERDGLTNYINVPIEELLNKIKAGLLVTVEGLLQ